MKRQISDYLRIRFLRLLLGGYLDFKQIYQEYQEQDRMPDASVIQELSRHFFDLKECAHYLFRKDVTDKLDPRTRDYQLLFDLVVGACYHEIHQLQENLYLVAVYRPRYDELQRNSEDEAYREYFQIGESLIHEAEEQIPSNLDWIWQLLLEALMLLKNLFPGIRQNRVVLRFICQHMALLEQVYGSQGTDEIFESIFPGGIQEALWRTTSDMVDSAHFNSALDSLSRLASVRDKHGINFPIAVQDLKEALKRIQEWGVTSRDNHLVMRSHSLMNHLEKQTGAKLSNKR